MQWAPNFATVGSVPAWNGSGAAAYTTTIVNLPAAAIGQPAQLRWRLGCDSSVSVTGAFWRIDSVDTFEQLVQYAAELVDFEAVPD